MKISFLLFATLLLLFACNNTSQNEKAEKHGYEIDKTVPSAGETMSASEKETKLALLISESKKTLDSIDMAYKNIRTESRKQELSLAEREQVNEALMDLNEAKDLIILETQQAVIENLKAKTSALKTVMNDMNLQSARMMNIAQTLSRISGVIEKTTNLMAGALSVGLIRPKLPGADVPM